jgi:4,5-DOPA dioxygenase extradiol
MNAIQRNDFTAALARAGEALPRPEAILVVSAHWLSRNGVAVSVAEQPETIHDFGPFHPDLFRITYSAPGAPRPADRVAELITGPIVRVDRRRGLDHGAWAVLLHLFPAAEIPVFQLSIDRCSDQRPLSPPAVHHRPAAARGNRAVPIRRVSIRQHQHALHPHWEVTEQKASGPAPNPAVQWFQGRPSLRGPF